LISLSIQPSPCLIQTSSARGSSINGSATGSNYQADTRYHIGSCLNIFLKNYLSKWTSRFMELEVCSSEANTSLLCWRWNSSKEFFWLSLVKYCFTRHG
jgi:hypothetical protein